MTVLALNTSSGPYVGNGATTVFPFTFSVGSSAELQVQVNDAVVTAGFTITLSANQSTTPGGSITFTTPPLTGATIVIASDPSFQQLISFKDSGPFLQSTLDIALDRVARPLLYLRDRLLRSITVPVGTIVPTYAEFLASVKGDPGSPGEGYPTRSAMAARAAPALLDDVYLTEKGREGKFVVDLASSWTAAIAADAAQAVFVPSTFDATKVYRRVIDTGVNVRSAGAAGDGTTDESPPFAATIAYLKAVAGNLSVNGYYKGSPRLFVPAGHDFINSTPLDVTHTLVIEGAGAGRFMTQGGGISRMRWAAGSSGIRGQFPNTTGDSSTTSYGLGAGGMHLRGLKIEGPNDGTDAAFAGVVCRVPSSLDDVCVYGWQGSGVQAIAASSGAYSSYSGNVSVSSFVRCRFENNQIGLEIRGADANVITVVNTEFISNRQYGYFDDSAIGSNVLVATHAAGNGLVSGAKPTQCTYSGKHYAAKLGGTFTNVPSGTTADTADWLYIEAGTADATRPAHTATPNTFRAGGDYVTTDVPIVTLLSPYAEELGFSQFGANTLVINPAISDRYMRGGVVVRASGGSLKVQAPMVIFGGLSAQGHTNAFGLTTGVASDTANFIDNSNAESAIYARSSAVGAGATIYAGFRMIAGAGSFYFTGAGAGGTHVFQLGNFGSTTTALTIDANGLTLPSGKNVTLTEMAAGSVATPAAGTQTLFVDSADHKLKRKDSGGTVTVIA